MVGADLDVLEAAAGIRCGAEREVQGVDAKRGGHVAVVGLGGHPVRPDVSGNACAHGFPSGCGALEDVDLRRRTTGSHNGNHLGGVADLRGEPGCEFRVSDRRHGRIDGPRTQQSQQSAHRYIVSGATAKVK